MTVRIPIGGHHGVVYAWAIVDDEDAALNSQRWCLSTNGYAMRSDDGRTVLMHRQILGLERGDPRQCDHANGCRLDNRRSNLRIVSRAQNAQNRPAWRPAFGYRGVHQYPNGRWAASAQVSGKTHHIGFFATEIEAAVAASEFRREHMPFTNELLESS